MAYAERTIYTMLFDEHSCSCESQFFYLEPGMVAQVQAVGLMDDVARVSDAVRARPQCAFLKQVLLREGHIKPPPGVSVGPEPVLFGIDMLRTEIDGVEEVRIDGRPIGLSYCNNMMLINTPGTYGFELNDTAAVGCARVYLRTFAKTEFPWGSDFFIGGRYALCP